MTFQSIAKSSFWVTASTVVTRFQGFIVVALLARLLGPADLGLFNLIQSTVTTGDMLSRVGVDAAIHRNGAQHSTIGNKATGRLFGVGACIVVSIGFLISILFWLLREPVAKTWLGEPRAAPWIGLASVSIFLTVLGNPPWFYLLALKVFKLHALRTWIISLVSAVSSVSLAWLFGYSGAMFSVVFVSLIHLLSGWYFTLPILQERDIKLRFDHFLVESRTILGFGLPFYSSNFLGSFVALPLLGFVSNVGGLEQVGYLRIAQSLTQFVSFLPQAIAPVIISHLSESIANNNDLFQKTKSFHLRSLWSLTLWITLVLSALLDFLIPVLFGSQFSEAILLSKFTIWIGFVATLSGMVSQYLISAGFTRLLGISQTIGLLINLLVALLLIPIYGAVGYLLSQASLSVFTASIYIIADFSNTRIQDKKFILFLLVLTCLSFSLNIGLSFSNLSLYYNIVFSVVLTMINIGFCWRLAFFAEERTIIFNLVKDFIKRMFEKG